MKILKRQYKLSNWYFKSDKCNLSKEEKNYDLCTEYISINNN